MTLKHSLSFISVITALFFVCPSASFGQHTSPIDASRKTISRYFSEVINKHALDGMGEFFSEGYIWHQMNGIDVNSSHDSSHISTLRWLFTAIPDVQYTIDHIIAEEDLVALNSTASGTAKGEMFGLPAVQRKVRFKQMFFFRIINNRITEEWEVVDLDGIKTQLTKP